MIPVASGGVDSGSTDGPARIRGGRGGGRRRSTGRKRFDGPPLSFDLFEDIRQGLDSEDVFGQLGQQSQVAGLQATAAQDVESAVLRPLSSPGGGRGRVGRGEGLLRRPGEGLLRRPVKGAVRRGATAVRRAVRSGIRSEVGVRRRPSVRVVVRHDGGRNARGVSCRQKVSGKTRDVKSDLKRRKG